MMVYSAFFYVALMAVICLPMVALVVIRNGDSTDHKHDR